MTLSELTTALKRFGFDDADPLTIWINAGLNKFLNAADWEFSQQALIASAVANARVVPFTFEGTVLLKPISMYDQTHGNKLRYVNPRKYQRLLDDSGFTVASTVETVSPGEPVYYTVQKPSTVVVWPVPQDATTYSIIFYGGQAELASPGDTPAVIPARHHYAIVLAAAAIALQAENEEERSANARSEYEAWVSEALDRDSTDQADSYDQVEDTQGYLQ